MGLTSIHATVSAPLGERELDFLVDSGALYTVLPREHWVALGLEPRRRLDFSLADGTRIYRDVSECEITFGGQRTHTPVVLGEADDSALLGAVTLEELGLVLNPLNRTLQEIHRTM